MSLNVRFKNIFGLIVETICYFWEREKLMNNNKVGWKIKAGTKIRKNSKRIYELTKKKGRKKNRGFLLLIFSVSFL
jgi:hypothetical protein